MSLDDCVPWIVLNDLIHLVAAQLLFQALHLSSYCISFLANNRARIESHSHS